MDDQKGDNKKKEPRIVLRTPSLSLRHSRPLRYVKDGPSVPFPRTEAETIKQSNLSEEEE